MKFRIEREPWIVGQHAIPPTTVIDYAARDQWSPIVRGHVPPATATALDQEASDAMFRAGPQRLMQIDHQVETATAQLAEVNEAVRVQQQELAKLNDEIAKRRATLD